MNKLFKRKILERIDYFNYIDPDIFYDDDRTDDKKDEKKKSEKSSKEKEYGKGDKHLSKKQATDVRKYMQYSNVKND